MQAVFVEAPGDLLGTGRRVRITAAPGNSLAAQLVAGTSADEVAESSADNIGGLGADEVAA